MAARINLAPEVYQQHQRAKQLRRTATTIATLLCVISIGLVVTCLIVVGSQTALLAIKQNNITNKQAQIKGIADLQDAATVAQHLQSLDSLQKQRLYFTKFFGVMHTVIPQGIGLSNLAVDGQNTLTMSAEGLNYQLATKFAKALEACNIEICASPAASQAPYFSNVVLSGVATSQGSFVGMKLSTTVAEEVTSGNK